MPRTEANVSPSGATTLPKALRDRLHLANGGRLRWRILDDGRLQVQVVLRYASAPMQDGRTAVEFDTRSAAD